MLRKDIQGENESRNECPEIESMSFLKTQKFSAVNCNLLGFLRQYKRWQTCLSLMHLPCSKVIESDRHNCCLWTFGR